MTTYRALAIYALVAAAPLGAADLEAALARCGQIEDTAERVACYDSLAGRADSSGRTAAPALRTATIAAPGEAAKPSPRQSEAAAGAAGEPDQSVWRRWFKRDRKEAAEEAGGDGPRRNRASRGGEGEAVAGEIVRLRKLMYGNFQLTLDNGQVWRENEYEPHTVYAVGDPVTIEQTFMGTRLRNNRTRQSVRVRRVR